MYFSTNVPADCTPIQKVNGTGKKQSEDNAKSAAMRLPPAQYIPPPPPGADEDLCQLLLSWFIAGYQSGVFMESSKK